MGRLYIVAVVRQGIALEAALLGLWLYKMPEAVRRAEAVGMSLGNEVEAGAPRCSERYTGVLQALQRDQTQVAGQKEYALRGLCLCWAQVAHCQRRDLSEKTTTCINKTCCSYLGLNSLDIADYS